jgi:anti-sigma regulatory factor (Ser/Thr protein kinase)
VPDQSTRSGPRSGSSQISLPSSPASAAAARRFIEASVAAWSLPKAAGEQLVLVGSELVTNAFLHARTPLTLSLEHHPDRVRISVKDASSTPATLRRYRPDALTGRGLGVVAAVSRRWGINAAPDGKVAWAEVDASDGVPSAVPRPPDLRLARSRAATPAATPGSREVRFVGVPVDAYLELQAHNDALFRELELISIELAAQEDGAVTGSSPPDDLVDQLYSQFRGQRDSYRDAVASAQADGRQTVDLATSVPPAAVGAARAYLELLEQADELCRTGVLLTPEPPARVRALRRWFVDQMAAQLLEGAAPSRPD